MRVLMIEGVLHANGATQVNLDFAARWQAHDDEVRLLVFETQDAPVAAVPPGLLVIHANHEPRRFRSAVPRIPLPLLRQCRWADVVVSGSEVGYGLLLGWIAARVARKPFAVVVHAPVQQAVKQWDPAKLRSALLWVHRHVDLALCVGSETADAAVANGLPVEKTVVFQPGIDVSKVRAQGIRLPRPTTEQTIVAVGSWPERRPRRAAPIPRLG